MLIKLSSLYKETWPNKLSYRSFVLYMYDLIRTDNIYDILEYSFYTEKTGYGKTAEYIPMDKRRPAAKNNICKKVVDDSVSLLFSEAHFPKIHSDDDNTRNALRLIAKSKNLNEVMIEAALFGSIGSVAIQVGAIEGEMFYLPIKTVFLTPEYENEKTRVLKKVTEKKQVSGKDLSEAGYNIKDEDLTEVYWFIREWNKLEEIQYVPVKRSADTKKQVPLKVDKQRSIKHNLGFVPIVWIRNLPGGNMIDGPCTFSSSIDIMIDRDYLMSQSGRGLRYSADPTLLIKAANSMIGDDEIIKSADRALVIGEDADAKLLEIAGTASSAVDKHVRTLRDSGMEVIHGNRANADKLSVAQSGRAMEMMNQDLVWLADRLRITYGESGLMSLLRMTLRIMDKNKVVLNGERMPKIKVNTDLTLVWPPWYASTPDDLMKKSVAYGNLVTNRLISRETAIRSLASEFDIEDVDAEKAKIEADWRKEDEQKDRSIGATSNTSLSNNETSEVRNAS